MRVPIIVLGLIFLLVGLALFAYNPFAENYLGNVFDFQNTDRPYQQYSYPLLVGGIVILILGFILKNKKKKFVSNNLKLDFGNVKTPKKTTEKTSKKSSVKVSKS